LTLVGITVRQHGKCSVIGKCSVVSKVTNLTNFIIQI